MNPDTHKVTINVSTVTLLKIVIFVLLLMALYLIRDIVLMVLISMVLASAMDPLVDWLYRKAKFPRGLSVILVYLVFISLVATVVYFVIPPIVTQFNQLAGRFQGLQEEFANKSSIFTKILERLEVANAFSKLGENFTNLTSRFFQTTLGVFSGIVQLIAVLAITFYLISSENGMKNFIKPLVPFKHQAYAMSLTEKVQKKIGHWLLGQLILSGFIFLLTFLGLSILGVKYALVLALFAGLLEIIPYLGPVLSAIPAVFVALVQSPPLAFFVVLLYIVVQQTENYILVPKIMGLTVGANPVIILLAVLIGFKLAGILGMLLAVPIVAATGVFMSDFVKSREGQIEE